MLKELSILKAKIAFTLSHSKKVHQRTQDMINEYRSVSRTKREENRLPLDVGVFSERRSKSVKRSSPKPQILRAFERCKSSINSQTRENPLSHAYKYFELRQLVGSEKILLSDLKGRRGSRQAEDTCQTVFKKQQARPASLQKRSKFEETPSYILKIDKKVTAASSYVTSGIGTPTRSTISTCVPEDAGRKDNPLGQLNRIIGSCTQMASLKKEMSQRLVLENRKLRNKYQMAKRTFLDENGEFKQLFINAAKGLEKENEDQEA